jgi:predicted transcriptional regulator
MKKVTADFYKLTSLSIVLPFNENITYYWYVIPHITSDQGSITGICSSGVVYFDFGPQNKIYDINFTTENPEITLEPGSAEIIYSQLKNNGNQVTTVDISVEIENPDYIKLNLEFKTITIKPKVTKTIPLSIIVLENIEDGIYHIEVTAVSKESTVIKDTIDLEINISRPSKGFEDDKALNDFDRFMQSPFAMIFVVIIILLITIFLYSKIKRHRLLQHERREKIYNFINENPGEHFRAIQKKLELQVGVLAHHINKLEREEFIKSRQNGQYRRFYPMDAKIDIKLILSQLQERILNFIKKNPGQSGKAIATNLEIDPKLVNYHVKVLQKAGFIYVEEKGRETLCFSAVS